MAHPRAISALVVLAVLVAAGCTGGVDNEVCKDVESYSIAMGRMESVEGACDDCVTALAVSGQQERCLQKQNFISTFNGRKDLEPGQHTYPMLYNRDDEWSECTSLDQDNAKLYCGCCLLLGKEYKFREATCQKMVGTSYLKSMQKWEIVDTSEYLKDGQCV